MPDDPRSSDLDTLLDCAVDGIGGTTRPGQRQMAHAVAEAVATDRHLLVQAGTGTGKSLAYLVPALAHAQSQGKPVVIATATLALQAQIIDKDLPAIGAALVGTLSRPATYALVKGRRHYVCVHKLAGGYPRDDEDALLSAATVAASSSWLGREVARLREWAEETTSGDRDELVPGVSERAWRQVSVSGRECLGGRCPMIGDCFVEQARARAADVDVVVTNHSFMAIDAFEGRGLLPEHDLLIVDEAHELVDRVTSTITDEISAGSVGAAARKAGRIGDSTALLAGADALEAVLADLPEGRLDRLPDELLAALGQIEEAAREVATEMSRASGSGARNGPDDGGRALAKAALDEVVDVAQRLRDERELDVAWVSRDPRRETNRIYVAPMSVAMRMRDTVFAERTVVMTSATLELGGSFDAVAGTLGLRGEGAPDWTGLDVGSPFDYRSQAIVYVARHLPPPGRDGPRPELLDEIETLVRAAGGRTLGLFSSMRAAQEAAEEMHTRLGADWRVLCQGEDQTTTLVRDFAEDASTCLFGTLSLWQGVDVPGSACQLVLIDRIPFPRPDDPLSSARARAVARQGGNGFLAVSATHAALRLAQGSGRLIRRSDDRGVVAILDPRMVTARYAGFLQASLPPFWPTTSRDLVLAALTRLDDSAPPVLPTTAAVGRAGAPGADPSADPVPAPTASRTAVTDGHAWRRSTDDELRHRLEAGGEPEAVAAELGVSQHAARTRAAQLGFPLLGDEVADPNDAAADPDHSAGGDAAPSLQEDRSP